MASGCSDTASSSEEENIACPSTQETLFTCPTDSYSDVVPEKDGNTFSGMSDEVAIWQIGQIASASSDHAVLLGNGDFVESLKLFFAASFGEQCPTGDTEECPHIEVYFSTEVQPRFYNLK